MISWPRNNTDIDQHKTLWDSIRLSTVKRTRKSYVRAYQFRELGFPIWYGSTIGNMVNNLFRDDDLIRVRMTTFVQHHWNPNRLEWPWITNLTKPWKNPLGRVLRLRHHQLLPTSFLRRDVGNRAQSLLVFRFCLSLNLADQVGTISECSPCLCFNNRESGRGHI